MMWFGDESFAIQISDFRLLNIWRSIVEHRIFLVRIPMNNQFSAQLTKLQQLLPSALDAYRQALGATFNLAKEFAILAWLTVCLVLVIFDWIGNTAIATGKRSKALVDNLKAVNSEELASETGKSLLNAGLTAGKSTLAYTVAQARDQLGISEKS
jgi:hypothetical protein